jgi:hypothetical protein
MSPQYHRSPDPATPAAQELHKAIRSIKSAARHFNQCFLHARRNPESQRLLSFAKHLEAVIAPLAKIERSLS